MVVQTRLFSCGLSISHVERRPAASPQRAARVRENVGNPVCPALFHLGERARVVMLSVTEGDDKPLKYPHMFRAAEVVVITKSDLLPHVDFSIGRCLANVRAVNRPIRSFVLSATTGEGVGAWYDWLNAERAAAVEASI